MTTLEMCWIGHDFIHICINHVYPALGQDCWIIHSQGYKNLLDNTGCQDRRIVFPDREIKSSPVAQVQGLPKMF